MSELEWPKTRAEQRQLAQSLIASGAAPEAIARAWALSDAPERAAEHWERAIHAAIAHDQCRVAVALADEAIQSAARATRGRMYYLRLLAIERGALGDVDTSAKQALAAVGSPSDAIDVRLALGRVALVRGDTDTALRIGSTMKPLLGAADKRRRAAALELEASAKWSQGQLSTSITLHSAAAALLREDGDAFGEAQALNARGLVRGYTGDFNAALEDHEAAAQVLTTAPAGVERERARGQVQNAFGFTLWNLGRYDEALTALTAALALRQQVADRDGEGITENNLGNVHRSCGRVERARACYARAIVLCEQSGNRLYEAIALNNLGDLACDAEDFALAKTTLDRALALVHTLGDRIREADNYASLGVLALATAAYPQAVECLEKAVQLRRQLRDNAYLVSNLAALAVASLHTGDRESAQHMIAEVEELLRAGQQGIEHLQAVYLHAHDVYVGIGDTAHATQALDQAIAELEAQLARLEDHAARRALLQNVAANRRIAALALARGKTVVAI